MSKVKYHKKITLHGASLRIVEVKKSLESEPTYQAQVKLRDERVYKDYGNEGETFDHACYWVLDAIESFYQDGMPRTLKNHTYQ